MLIIKKIFLLFVLLIPVSSPAAANAVGIVSFLSTDKKLDLNPHVEILIDSRQELKIDDVVNADTKHNFQPSSVTGNSFGYTSAAFWLRFTLLPDAALDDSLLLHLEYPLIDNVTLFVPDGQGGFSKKITGKAVAFHQRDVDYRNVLFNLPQHQGKTRTYYMRIQSNGSTQIPLSLWAATAFIEEVDASNIIIGIYYGIMSLLLVAALVSYIKLRDKLFLYYGLYLFSYLILQLSLNGLSYQYFWSGTPGFTSRVATSLIGLVIIGGTVFSGSFLQIWDEKHPRIKRLFYTLIGLGVISIVLCLITDVAIAAQFSTIVGIISPPIIMIGAISSVMAGYRPAYYFLLAWSFFLFGIFIAGLLYLGLLPHNFFTFYAMQIGSVLEVVMLGYALLDRIDLSRSEKDTAIENANKYISRLYNGLEALVEERTQQLSESEAHLRTLIQTLPDLVWWKNPDGIYLGCNPKFERYFGAAQADIIGKSDYDFVSKELADFFREKDRVAIMAGVACTNEEEVSYADDGHTELLETIKMPMYGPDNELIGVLGVGRDITERRRSEQALLNTKKMEAIGQLTGGIAHDFNNILAIVIGNLSLLKNQFTDNAKATKRIETIEKSAKRAADLTKQLLGFSRNKAEQRTIININRLMEDMDSLIARSVTPQVEVTQNFEKDLWHTEIDPGDFQDALINLVINARDAMAGGGMLTLATKNRVLDDDYCELNPDMLPGEYVVLTVTDNGIGMTPEQQKHIFEPFFTTKEQGKGTGLGLAMVFGFVGRSNGLIKVISEPDMGTTFRVYLPKCQGEESLPENETEKAGKLPHGQETILVVDDEEALLELAQETLEALDYKVLTAVNAKQALELLAREPDIKMLLSDVLMPGGMNGYELAERAVESWPELKVLFASGYTSKVEVGKIGSDFSSNLLLKPYRLSELAKRVRETLDA